MPEIHDNRLFPVIEPFFVNKEYFVICNEVSAKIFYAVSGQLGAAVRVADNAPVGIKEILVSVQRCTEGRFTVVIQRIAATVPDIERIRVAVTVFF